MTSEAAASRSRRILLLIPLAIFSGLTVLFFSRLGEDAARLPSTLIGRPAPAFAMEPLQGLMRDGRPVPGLSRADLDSGVTVVNVWASWCGPCRDEHPFLLELAKDARFRLVGVNYKDSPENARRFLGALGNPFIAVGVDPNGRTSIDWGVYGIPETFVVAKGIVVYKHIGPLTEASLKGKLADAIAEAAKR
jgi:cytochrome c biogenesis protein CcmG/thiol:disulfide interchange protein DsbE